MSELAEVTRITARGMITLRGDLTAAKIKKAVKAVTGHAIPAPGRIAGAGDKGVVWMSPDELLVLVPYAEVDASIAQLEAALDGAHFLIADVSDARSVFRIEGPHARGLLARLSPVDMHISQFGSGDVRRTRLAQVAGAIWCDDAGFDVVCFRSVGDYAEQVLRNAAAGAPVENLG